MCRIIELHLRNDRNEENNVWNNMGNIKMHYTYIKCIIYMYRHIYLITHILSTYNYMYTHISIR